MKVWVASWFEEVMAVATTEDLARKAGAAACMERFGCELTNVEEWEVLNGSTTE